MTWKAALLISVLSMSMPVQAQVKADIDTDNSGTISLEEFVTFSTKRDLKQRDDNDDNILSSKEWLGQSQAGFRHAAIKKFDGNKDGDLIISEIVNIYVWTFRNRDKNKDNQLSGDEIPKNMLSK